MHESIRPLTKRDFIVKAAALAVGSMILSSGLAVAAPKVRNLQATIKGASNRAFQGMRRRFGRIRVSSIDDAFRLANRKAEIEFTIL